VRIVFATTQSATQSTVIGRVLPLAEQFAKTHQVHLLLLGEVTGTGLKNSKIQPHSVGRLPYHTTSQGKRRLKGIALVINMLITSLTTAWRLSRLNPEVVIIVKSLPANVLGVWLWHNLVRISSSRSPQIILDVDDFELTANVLTSLPQRAAVHWAERVGAKMANRIVGATPFLVDHFKQLTGHRKQVELIPTGLTLTPLPSPIRRVSLRLSRGSAILYAGSLSISSGHRVDLLPEILALVIKSLPHATLTIAGDGDDTDVLEKKFAARGLTQAVTWHGRFTPSEIPPLISQVDLLIDPIDASIAQRAKSSFRVALATAAGIPIVTSNIGIRPLLIPASLQQLFFAEPASATDYASKIVALLQRPLVNEQVQQLTRHAKRYTWDQLGQQYQQLIAPS